MRIIFSRKGFDSAAGGCPSPIVDGRPHSLPIPTKMPTTTRFGDLGGDIGDMVEGLSRGRQRKDFPCHLDPDLDMGALPRQPDWRGTLGQVGAAQSHLDNNQVGLGDLFLFWGLFRPVSPNGNWRFEGSREHRIFGWLQIGSVLRIGNDPTDVLERHPWLVDHPHAQPGWPSSNTIYVASDRLTVGDCELNCQGWGLFNHGLRLTALDSPTPSAWQVPDWLNPERGGTGMTYHPQERWDEQGRLQAASRGQEFIANMVERRDAVDWLLQLFGANR